jgi:hypothetical protein
MLYAHGIGSHGVSIGKTKWIKEIYSIGNLKMITMLNSPLSLSRLSAIISSFDVALGAAMQ